MDCQGLQQRFTDFKHLDLILQSLIYYRKKKISMKVIDCCQVPQWYVKDPIKQQLQEFIFVDSAHRVQSDAVFGVC